MIGMPFRFEGKGVLEAVVAAAAKAAEGEAGQKWKEGTTGEPTSVLDTRRSPSPPTSSSTLSSSLGGGGGGDSGIGVAAVHQKWAAAEGGGGSGRKDNEWGLEPIPAGLEIGGGGGAAEDCWESLLTASGSSSPCHDPAYLRYFLQEMEAHPQQQYLLSLAGSSAVHDFDVAGGGAGFGGLVQPGFAFEPPPAAVAPPSINNPPLSGFPMMNAAAKFPNNPAVFPPLQIPPGMFFQEGLAATVEEKPPPPPPPQLFMNPQQAHPCQNPAFFLPFPCTPQEQLPPPKRHHVMDPPPLPQQQLPQDVFLRRKPQEAPQRPAMKPKAAMATVGVGGGTIDENQQHQQQQIVVNQLYKAAELVETGNSPSARGILARLNQQLSFSSNNNHHHLGKPLLRAALLFKDALLRLIDSPSPKDAFSCSAASLTPMEVFLKISADKAFSEISPVTQFSTFTANQAILDELSGSYRIHVLDFDVGIGGQWASFLQELSLRRTNSVVSLRITVFASPSSHPHPLELALTKESLAHFAGDLGILFEFTAVNLDSFNPATLGVSPEEVVVVNLPAGPSMGPPILRFVKQLHPRIVVSVDHGSVGGGGSGGGGEYPFSHHFLHTLQSNVALLDSIHAAGADPEAVRRIEAFLVRPRIEAAVAAAGGGRRLGDGQQQLHWRSQFASAGFVPVALSNFTEAQADCLVKRFQVRGFHVEKPNASSLVLCWQRAELVSFSAWRC